MRVSKGEREREGETKTDIGERKAERAMKRKIEREGGMKWQGRKKGIRK